MNIVAPNYHIAWKAGQGNPTASSCWIGQQDIRVGNDFHASNCIVRCGQLRCQGWEQEGKTDARKVIQENFMRLHVAMIIAALLVALPARAQTGEAQQKPPAPHQPGVAAKPAEAQAAGQTVSGSAAAATPTMEKMDPSKETAIRHLMDVTGTSKMGETVSKGINSQVEASMKRVIVGPRLQKFMEDFSQKFNEAAPSGTFTDTTVAIYARHFSTEDIEEMTKFYESPVGQKVLKELPDAQQESFSSSQDTARQAAMKVLRSMSDEYTELQRMLPPDPNQPQVKPASPPAAAAPGTPATPATPAPAPASGAAATSKPAPAPPPAATLPPAPAPKPAPAPQPQ
jgi:hypothetical protein